MRKSWARAMLLAAMVFLVVAASLSPAHAIHWYRNTDGGCAPADGALTDDPVDTVTNVSATVAVGHNTFGDRITGTGFSLYTLRHPYATRIKAGESITWTWNSAHCHSVTSTAQVSGTPIFDSGFFYPTTPPESPQVAPGLFEYPLLDETPTLTYTHTFTTPGVFDYFCVHHASIGMNGVVLVEP